MRFLHVVVVVVIVCVRRMLSGPPFAGAEGQVRRRGRRSPRRWMGAGGAAAVVVVARVSVCGDGRASWAMRALTACGAVLSKVHTPLCHQLRLPRSAAAVCGVRISTICLCVVCVNRIEAPIGRRAHGSRGCSTVGPRVGSPPAQVYARACGYASAVVNSVVVPLPHHCNLAGLQMATHLCNLWCAPFRNYQMRALRGSFRASVAGYVVRDASCKVAHITWQRICCQHMSDSYVRQPAVSLRWGQHRVPQSTGSGDSSDSVCSDMAMVAALFLESSSVLC